MNSQTQKLAARRLEQFLVELVNLRADDPEAASRLVRRFLEFGLSDWVLVRAVCTSISLPGLPSVTNSATHVALFSKSVGHIIRANSRSALTLAAEKWICPYLQKFFLATWIETDTRTLQWSRIVLASQYRLVL